MTKDELIEFLKPFMGELRLAVEDCEGDLRDIEPRYIMIHGEGIVVLGRGGIL